MDGQGPVTGTAVPGAPATGGERDSVRQIKIALTVQEQAGTTTVPFTMKRRERGSRLEHAVIRHSRRGRLPGGALNVNGPVPRTGTPCTTTLQAGTYWYSSLRASGNGRLCTTGQVIIYVTGAFDVGGNGMPRRIMLRPIS